jgi:ribosome-associated translation inhibitor RaiA
MQEFKPQYNQKRMINAMKADMYKYFNKIKKNMNKQLNKLKGI